MADKQKPSLETAKTGQDFYDYGVTMNDAKQIPEFYKHWAHNYDKFVVDLNYQGPTELMKHFDKFNMKKDAKILDICSGTGVIGVELNKRGYTNIHAIDGSEHMIEIAKKLNVYKNITYMLILPDTPLPYKDGEFDCVLLSGSWESGHLPIKNSLNEIARVLKPGGIASWASSNPDFYADADKQYADNAFFATCEDIEARGLWKKMDGYPVNIHYCATEPGYVIAFQSTVKHN